MVLSYLGTAAAEGLPAVWCNCPACTAARKAGGKEIRTRSQILIDDKLLVDFPMDTYMHVLRYGFDLSAVDTVLITHAHMDHCYPQEFCLHGAPFAHDLREKTVTVIGNATVAETFAASTKAEMRESIATSVPFRTVRPFDVLTTPSGYEVTALPAVHTVGEECLIYAVRRDGKTALFFNDSGILPEQTYARMSALGLRFDLVSFDCTYGFVRHGAGRHMGALDAADEREKLLRHGLTHAHTRYILTHFSHNGALPYDTLAQKAREIGFAVAYDGMKVEL